MSLLEKFRQVEATRAGLKGVDPTKVVVERQLSATRAIINGRETLLAGTNNYLGLTFDKDTIAAGQAALAEFGTGTTGSRMANGNYAQHVALERELAAFYGYPHALVFSTGYAANVGTLAALLSPDDAVLMDAHAHASLFDGVKATRCELFTFRHNDTAGLSRRLARLGARCARTLVIVEGLYSVTGDIAPLADIAATVAEHNAMLFVDEAHSLGVLGENGRGVVEHAGVLDQVDFVVGTFSKSLGTTGGFCTSRHAELTLFPYASRPYMFTASPSPATIASTRKALEILQNRPALRTQLLRNSERLRTGLMQLGLPVNDLATPVACVGLGNAERGLGIWKQLLDDGLYVNLMLPPATPGNEPVLRLSVSAAHTDADIDALLSHIRQRVC